MSTNRGLENLKLAVKNDQEESPNIHDYQGKLDWIIERAKHYELKTGIPYLKIVDAWEEKRSYWYMNYYQESRQPLLTDEKVYIFETVQDFYKSIDKKQFRCPSCRGVSISPYECTKDTCDWKSYGFLGTMSNGATIFIKEKFVANEIFFPVVWETGEVKYCIEER